MSIVNVGSVALVAVACLWMHNVHAGDAALLDAAPPVSVDLPPDVMAPVLSIAASEAQVQLGRPFVVIVTAVFRPDMKVNLADPITLGPSFEVQRRWSNDSLRTDGKTQRQWQIEVLPWELGDQVLPPIAVTFVAGGRANQIATPPLAIRILGALGDSDIVNSDKLRPLLPPKLITTRTWFWLWVGGVGLAAAALASFALLWSKRHRRRIERITGGEVAWRALDDAGKRALRALADIEQSGVNESNPLQGFERMASIMRTFGSQRYGFVGNDLTTTEWLASLRQQAPNAKHELFARWFAPVDMVKYASTKAQSVDAAAVLRQARALVVVSMRTSQVVENASTLAQAPEAARVVELHHE